MPQTPFIKPTGVFYFFSNSKIKNSSCLIDRHKKITDNEKNHNFPLLSGIALILACGFNQTIARDNLTVVDDDVDDDVIGNKMKLLTAQFLGDLHLIWSMVLLLIDKIQCCV